MSMWSRIPGRFTRPLLGVFERPQPLGSPKAPNNWGNTGRKLASAATAAIATALLNALTGDSGSGGIKGLAPAPGSGDFAAGKYLDAGANWSVPQGSPTAGDVKPTMKTSADAGWIMWNDSSIGDGSSGATNRANADTVNLFTLLYNGYSDTNCPIQTSAGAGTTRGAQGTAAAAYAAHCRLVLPKSLGRLIGNSGAGSGLTSRGVGDQGGAETITIGTGNLPSHNHSGNNTGSTQPTQGNGGTAGGGGSGNDMCHFDAGGHLHSMTPASVGSGTAQNVMNPFVFIQWMIKL